MSTRPEIRVTGVELYFLPVQTRVPLKFGTEILTSVTCARARVSVEDGAGRPACGWGETPLSVQWVWPSRAPYEGRHAALREFCVSLARAWGNADLRGHALEVGWDFQEHVLPCVLREANTVQGAGLEPIPRLAALLCCSVFDQALHDAYGRAVGRSVYTTYSADYLRRDLTAYLASAPGSGVSFQGRYPAHYLTARPPGVLDAWHLVGGADPIEAGDLTGSEPNDGYPVLLADWIRRDGLRCLKVKLRGNDARWDFERLARVGQVADAEGVDWLSADFNCTVMDPQYVLDILGRLERDHPSAWRKLLYVEQPFPYDLEACRIDAHSISARKPLFLDESAHDWRLVRLGRDLGWNGVALKTCKTQTGAILSACWARAHGMQLMVQDLTNPMLAQVPHVLLAAHVGTIRGVETNAMQFYPEASLAEAAVHPGLYRRRNGQVDLRTIGGPGFGYRVELIRRELPAPAVTCGSPAEVR